MTSPSDILPSEDVQALVSKLLLLEVVKCIIVASLTFGILEILVTLPDEITLVWPDRLNPMKVIYFVNKYSVIMDTLLATTIGLWTPHDPQVCKTQFIVAAYAYLAGILFSEVILAMRTVALWGYNKKIVFLLCAGYLEIIGCAIFAVHETSIWITAPSHKELQVVGCLLSVRDKDVWPAYACLIIGETAIVVLTFLKRHLDHNMGSSSSTSCTLVGTMYRDGLFSYLVVLALSITNLLMMFLAPEGLTPLVQMPIRVIHSALCTRVLLNLRRAAAEPASGVSMSGNEYAERTTLVFETVACPRSQDGRLLDGLEPEDLSCLA